MLSYVPSVTAMSGGGEENQNTFIYDPINLIVGQVSTVF